MRKSRLIFYVVFGIFQIATFVFTLVMQAFSEDFSFLMQIFKFIYLFKYIAFLGIGLIIADIVWAIKAHKDSEKEKNALYNELTMLKAKLFDIQEAAKTKVSHSAGTEGK